MFDKILVANRGEVARRIIRSARRLDVRTVAVYSTVDEGQPHVADADEAVHIGSGPPTESYLDGERILQAAREAGAEAIHPGYGFLSENPGFARSIEESGIVWIGPPSEAIELVGDKATARAAMREADVPLNEGVAVDGAGHAEQAAGELGFPIMVKARGGGGGIGMEIAHGPEEVVPAVERCCKLGERFFGQGDVLLERFHPDARHVEIQVFGLSDGRVVALGERECSVQRRYQKVLEETPSPVVDRQLRAEMCAASVRGAEQIGFRNAGTFEFLVSDGRFMFLEVNARLQVEHPITELTTGIDIVAEQTRAAAKASSGFDPEAVEPDGHAIELRVYAEDPHTFLPSPGSLTEWEPPTGDGVRVDSGYQAGNDVPRFYDPLLAKLCVHDATRQEAISRGQRALGAFRIEGVKTNIPFLERVLDSPAFRAGDYDTRLAQRLVDQDSGE